MIKSNCFIYITLVKYFGALKYTFPDKLGNPEGLKK